MNQGALQILLEELFRFCNLSPLELGINLLLGSRDSKFFVFSTNVLLNLVGDFKLIILLCSK
jgi:hypothetical protein